MIIVTQMISYDITSIAFNIIIRGMTLVLLKK